MKNILLLLSLLIFSIPLLSDNHMDQIAHMQGEHGDARFGKYTASLDFNGDGYNDLVVRGGGSTGGPAPYYYGRLYFYFGCVGFDNEPDFTISSSDTIGIICNHVVNLGDVNNDGKEDLGCMSWKDDNYVFQILLGNNEQDSIPDFEMYFPDDDYDSGYIRALGDINNDGYDDVGISITGRFYDPNKYYIIYGNYDDLYPILFDICGERVESFSGVGDVNDDGFDDFCLGYRFGGSDRQFINKFYYGGEIIDTSDYVTLWEDSSTNMTLGLPAGDLNDDGFDDFVGHFDNSEVNIWFGWQTITSAYNLTINGGYGGYTSDYGYDYGDLNADGYTDMVFGAPWWAMDCGRAFLYLDGANPNSTVDLEFPWQDVGTEYGQSVSIGDFNMDGFDDVAIAGPTSPLGNGPGHVYVFAGNADLTDLYGIDDEPAVPDVMFTAHSNPFRYSTNISFSLPHFVQKVYLKIYNIRGQLVRELDVDTRSGIGTISWDCLDRNGKRVGPGIYFCKLTADKKETITTMVLIR